MAATQSEKRRAKVVHIQESSAEEVNKPKIQKKPGAQVSLKSKPEQISSKGSSAKDVKSVKTDKSVKSVKKALTTVRIGGRVGIAGLLGLEPTKPAYTIDNLECRIYDNRHHDNETMLLMPDSLVPIDGNEQVPPHLIRCLIDVSAQYIDTIMIFAVLGTCCTTPLTFIWGGKAWTSSPIVPGAPFTFVFDILMDFIYAAYLLLRLNTSFIHSGTHVEVVNRQAILEHHLRHPLYWLKWLGTTMYIWIAAGAPAIINLFKVVRITHIRKLPDSLWEVTDSSAYRMSKPVILLIICSHWVACFMSCVGGYRETIELKGPHFFRANFDGKPVGDYISAYLRAFIESIYMLTGSLDNPLGDGGGRDRNFGSLLIVAFFGPLGCVGAALFIAAIVREQALACVLDIRHAENKAFIARALKILNIPKALQVRVFSLHYFQRMGHDFEAFEQLFNNKNLSGPLDIALRVYLYSESVLYSRYFKDIKDINYILEVVRILEDCIFLPGDYVARCGEVGTQMYFVARGKLTVLIPSRRESKRTDIKLALPKPNQIKKGDYFGDVALLQDCTRTAWVRADTYCLLSMLTRHAIEEIWRYFPQERVRLIDIVKGRMNDDRRRHKEAAQHNWNKAHNQVAVATLARTLKSTLKSGGQHTPLLRSETTEVAETAAVDVGTDQASSSTDAQATLEPLPEEEEGINEAELGMMPQRTNKGDAPSSEDLKIVANRVDSTCEALFRNQLTIQRKLEALQFRIATLNKGQEAIVGTLTGGAHRENSCDDQNASAETEDLEFLLEDGISPPPPSNFKAKRKRKLTAKSRSRSEPAQRNNRSGGCETVISD